ncbi:MAG TPA: fatty acid desaturase, partial [Pseudorhodoferax sp.]|nr:fatty acid desaturase [Pseudorhodoferax sp.]
MSSAPPLPAPAPARPRPAARAVWWRRWEVPTVLLCLLFYPAWAALLWWHAALPGWLLFLVGGYLAQLHFSLQHESIHAMRGLPRWLRTALVWPPVNLWLPYPLYHRSHSQHHVNFHLTHPRKDTESAYHSAPTWASYSPFWRRVYLVNQTLAFRVLLGPVLRLVKLVRVEGGKLLAGDVSHVGIWAVHALSVAPVLYFVTQVCGMGFGEYLLVFVYPGMMLGALRTFTEHRW